MDFLDNAAQVHEQACFLVLHLHDAAAACHVRCATVRQALAHLT